MRIAIRRIALAAGVGVAACAGMQVRAAVVGVSVAAPSLTMERINALPAAKRTAWAEYFARSARQQKADRSALAVERRGLAAIPALPPEGGFAGSMPMDRDAAWYGTAEARHIGDVIVSFQTPAGGWSKNMSMAGAVRVRGQSWAANNVSQHLGPQDFDTPHDPQWNYMGTLDNDATTTQIHFLALLASANAGADGDAYRASYSRGIRYLLNAQFPNGGWPQVWPLEGGYHDAITFNDNAVTLAAEVLTNAASGEGPYAFVPAELRRAAAAGAGRALGCILAAQVRVDGHRTIWAQQMEALTLTPVSGRNYEPAALATGESADVLLYLMSLPSPDAAVQAAIRDGVEWLRGHAVSGFTYTAKSADGRRLVAAAGAGPLWPRYIGIATGKPVFGDRDKTIHDDVNELSLERRNGYSWWNASPQRALDGFLVWSKTHPQ